MADLAVFGTGIDVPPGVARGESTGSSAGRSNAGDLAGDNDGVGDEDLARVVEAMAGVAFDKPGDFDPYADMDDDAASTENVGDRDDGGGVAVFGDRGGAGFSGGATADESKERDSRTEVYVPSGRGLVPTGDSDELGDDGFGDDGFGDDGGDPAVLSSTLEAWTCAVCTLDNKPGVVSCDACGTDHPVLVALRGGV